MYRLKLVGITDEDNGIKILPIMMVVESFKLIKKIISSIELIFFTFNIEL